jgi:hypothetical protein
MFACELRRGFAVFLTSLVSTKNLSFGHGHPKQAAQEFDVLANPSKRKRDQECCEEHWFATL